MARVAVAARSARLLAQAAAMAGDTPIALDEFGDADTRRSSAQWLPISRVDEPGIDRERLLDALQTLARGEGAQAWVAGPGFEGMPDLLDQGARWLPLWGTAGADVRRVRDPLRFFRELETLGVAFPPVRAAGERGTASRLTEDRAGWVLEGGSAGSIKDANGWLVKDAHGSGGFHIRRAGSSNCARLAPSQYLQLEAPGAALSATFIGNGRDAVVLGINRQTVRELGDLPYVFHGVIGPVPASPRLRSEVREIVHALTEAFALRGVCSLDFLFDDQRLLVLEVNPRPPASLVLYPLSSGQPIWHAHVRACRDGLLPDSNSANAAHEAVVRGSEIVFARRPCVFGSAATSALGRDAAIHDVPRRGARFAPGDPVCSVSASGGDAETVAIELQRRVEAVYATLEELS